MKSLYRVTSITILLCLLCAVSCAAAPTPRAAMTLPRLTLLNEAGTLSRTVSAAEIAGWRRQLQRGDLSAGIAARLHLWLGEVEIARNREPERALEQFRLAQRLVAHDSPIYGCAAYDRAMTLYFEGAFDLATPAFHDLLRSGRRLRGYPITSAALWYRHAGACAGYHAKHAKLGITEPSRLDPLCGVASLAACLRANQRPYDRHTLLAHCRMTGLGNNMQDLVDCAKRLGMSAQMVRADDEGLKALPMPVVAYVELDHFVAVTRADSDGVSYLCSDCGAWPGGRRDLTWKQWRAMDCNLYIAVTRPGSIEDHAMGLLSPAGGPQHSAVSAPAAGRGPRLASDRHAGALMNRAWQARISGRHIVLYTSPSPPSCGSPAGGGHCTPGANCPSDGSGPGGGGFCPLSGGGGGPTDGEPVNLATGAEEYSPAPDLTVYNPIGPSVVWQRLYGSLRGPYNANGLFPYAQSAFGTDWDSSYDYQAVPVSGGVYFFNPNGGAYAFSVPATPTASNPQVACPAGNAGTPMLCTYTYNTDGSLSFVFLKPDRSQWVCSSLNNYALSRLVDRNGNFINFVYTTPGSAGYALSAITDSNNRPLLTIRRNARYNIVSVSDRYNRSVLYQVQRFPHINVPPPWPQFSDELVQVSQIVRAGTFNPPSRYRYGYIYHSDGEGAELLPALHTITVPSPTGSGVSIATINYDGVFVANIVDSNGKTRTYTQIDANDTLVTVTNKKYDVVYSYAVGFDSQMRMSYRTDGTNANQIYQASYLADNAYQPATVTNGNNQTTTYSYDQFGQVTSVTTPRNVTTTFTFDYSVFPLGELKQIQEGSKSPINITYYEPSGLPQTVSIPLPGTSGSTATATTSLIFDALGNLLSITQPGNDAAATITTTVNYTQDGSYHQAEAIGQPLTITDSLGHVTHLRYDAQGNLISGIDALGNETDAAYNIANQRTRLLAPAIGDVTNLLNVTRSALTYAPSTKTYNGTVTLTNTSSQNVQGSLLLALTNLAPGVTLANATGNYVNSPALLTPTVSLAPGAATTVNVSFSAPSANAVSYGVQTYLTDSTGNPVVLPSETRSTYLYPGGPLVSVNAYDETGARYREVSYRHGKEGELLAISGSTEPVKVTYDGVYRLLSLSDGNGRTTQYAYNTAGWLQSVTYPKGDGVQYPQYDADGHPLVRIDGRGIQTNYTYNDPESRLTNVQYTNSASYPNISQYNVNVDYDGYGRTQDVYDFSGHTHLDYDDVNTLTEIDTTYAGLGGGSALPTVSLIYSFNPDGSRHGMNVQTNTTSYDFAYGYDAAGRPISLTNPFSERTQWSYLANNWLASQQLANGVSAQYAYNRRGFLNDLTHYAANGAPLSDFGAMTYDAVANRLTKAVTIPGAPSGYSGQTGYTYDIKDQLTQEQSTLLTGSASFVYDPAGNPLSFNGSSHGFNSNNQFTDTGFAYDGEGNPTTYSGTTLTFDPEDHMTSFGNVLTAGYRADGLRAWKQTASGTTYFIYDGITPVLELDGNGNETAVNTFGANGLISRNTSAGSTFYTFDPQGGVALRLSATGSAVSASLFNAFGIGTGTTSATDPFGYGAQWSYYCDRETGLLLLGYRYYDPSAGRFINRDPLSYLGGINLYGYVTNGVEDYVDPLGFRRIIIEIGAGGTIGLPVPILSVFLHAELNVGISIDTADLANSQFYARGEVAPMAGLGAVLAGGGQVTIGQACDGLTPGASGDVTLHGEGGVVAGDGIAGSADFGKSGPSVAWAVKPSLGVGLWGAAGPGFNGTLTSPSIREILEGLDQYFPAYTY